MRLSIRLKLAVSFAGVILLSAIMAVLGIANLASLDGTLEQIVHGPVQRLDLIQSIYADLLLQVRAEQGPTRVASAPRPVAKPAKPVVRLALRRGNSVKPNGHAANGATIDLAATDDERDGEFVRY